MRSTTFSLIVLGFSLWLGYSPASAQSSTSLDEAIKSDLLTALLLEGRPCGAVVSYEENSEKDKIAECENSERYRLYATEEGTLKVVTLLVSPLKLVEPVLTRLLHLGRGVIGLLSLSGNACGSVLNVQSDGGLGQLVACEGGVLYHIVVRPNGRVEVVSLDAAGGRDAD